MNPMRPRQLGSPAFWATALASVISALALALPMTTDARPFAAGVADRLRLVYVADISGMPALVTRMFVLPKLRELPFPIALVLDIPRAAGSATVLRLYEGQVTQVATARQVDESRVLLGLPSRPDTR